MTPERLAEIRACREAAQAFYLSHSTDAHGLCSHVDTLGIAVDDLANAYEAALARERELADVLYELGRKIGAPQEDGWCICGAGWYPDAGHDGCCEKAREALRQYEEARAGGESALGVLAAASDGPGPPIAYLFANGNAAYFDNDGEQMSELQCLGHDGLEEFRQRYPEAPVRRQP